MRRCVSAWGLLLLAGPASAMDGSTELLFEELAVGGPVLGISGAAMVSAARNDAALIGATGLGVVGAVGIGVGVGRAYEPSEGQAMAFTTAQMLGAANGGGWGLGVGLADPWAGGLGLAGFGVGSLAGLELMGLDPDPGQVALVRSGVAWGVVTALGVQLIDPRGEQVAVRSTLFAADVGAAAGLLLAVQPWHLSRIAVLRVNMAGLGGAAVGTLIGEGLRRQINGSERTVVGSGVLGGLAGFGVGALFLADVERAPALALVPTRAGATLSWGGPIPVRKR